MAPYYINKYKPLKFRFKKFNNLIVLWVFVLCILLIRCQKLVGVDAPKTAITSATVYANDLSAASAVTGIYSNLMGGTGLSSGTSSISCLGGLLSDEFQNFNSADPIFSSCYSNALASTKTYFWPELFLEIYMTNAVLQGLSRSTGVTASEMNQLTGEAKFMRAFLHFYGTNLYGDFPWVTSTNYLTNNSIRRTPQTQVYQQIIADLKDAQSLLPDHFVTPTGGTITNERVRPNKGAATALLARVYLYIGDWANAKAQTTSVIQNTADYSLVADLNRVFLKNSQEAIWQMQPVRPGLNTWDAYYFILNSPPGSGSSQPVALTPSLVNSFDSGDKRRTQWVGSLIAARNTYYYPFKYKIADIGQPLTEYAVVLRLAEQYLIRAEAEAQLNDLTSAANDLNIIRNRAGLPNTTATTQADLLTAIYHERQVELFTEWGHRWFDLKRTGRLNSVMSVVTPQKGGTWSPNGALFPVPQSEITINPNLTQNPGYQQ